MQVIQSFRQVSQSLYRVFWNETSESESGLTSIQFMVLNVLKSRPNIGLAELADACFMGSSSMSGVVDRLVKAGYVSRERLESDRRVLTLRMTEKGEEIREYTNSLWMNRVSPILDIPKKDMDFVLSIHQRMIEKLEGKGMNTE
ncbi:MarR family transcriptional regulator [Paenibacillus sp. JX-17]|uniref:MarR family transcriptional regulator n=2 Tax=Paenibacillus lacisoli TaxID=3064525 RepID=A0ABT9C6U5_9BACL|nr:MarR family transcriptional regulator [Paenibacillus sp. JX-17]MDO7904986.1 MarR family transcriptional regulator [Paenibacillus sp. JX-17]